MTSRTMITALAAGRVVIGAALLAAPDKTFGSGWIGNDARKPTARLLLRAVGARDLALGLGTLVALRQGSSLKPWLLGATIADGTDLVATFAAGGAVPTQGKVGVGALAGGATVAQLALLREVD